MGLAFILIVRLLGPSSYGVYTLVIATAGFFGAFGDLGLSTMFVRTIPQYVAKKQFDKVKSTLVNGYAILIIESGLFTILAFALSGFVATSVFHTPSDTFALQLVSLTIILSVMWSASYNVLIGLGKGGKLIKVVIVQGLLQAFVSIALVVLGLGAIGPILGLITSYAASAIYGAWLILQEPGIRQDKMGFALKSWSGILHFCVPVGLSVTITSLVTNFSLIVLGWYASSAVIGNFGAAYKAIGVFDVLLGSIGIALLPFFAVALIDKKITKEISKYYNYSLYFVFLIAAPIVFYIVMLSKPFSFTIFSGTYTLTPLYLALMSIGTLIIVVGSTTSNLLIGAGKVRKVLKYNIIAAIVQIILLPILVQPLTGLGLVLLMFIIIPVLTGILFVNGAQEILKINLDLRMLTKVSIAAIISMLFIYPLVLAFGTNYIPLLAAAGVEQILLYPAIVSLFGGIDKERLKILDRVVGELPVFGSIMHLLTAYTSVFLR